MYVYKKHKALNLVLFPYLAEIKPATPFTKIISGSISVCFGAAKGTRTPTSVTPDPKSGASANSAIAASKYI